MLDAPKVFRIEGLAAQRLTGSRLGHHSLNEADLERWVVANPEILGPGVQIVATQYDRWILPTGDLEKSRLDILALDPSGQLIVVELKRDSDSKIHLQALSYAAMVATFKIDTLSEAHAAWLNRHYPSERRITPAEAEERLKSAADVDLDVAKVFSRPKIILIAERFHPQVYTTVKWLTDLAPLAIDIEIYVATLFTDLSITGDRPDALTLTFHRQFPDEGIETRVMSAGVPDDAVDPVTRKQAKDKRSRNSVLVIRENDLIADGQLLELDMGKVVNEEIRATVKAWVDADPTRGTATWVPNETDNLRWSADPHGPTWTATGLGKHIIAQATNVPTRQSLFGTAIWTFKGRTLHTIANEFQMVADTADVEL